MKVFVDTDPDIRLARRLSRDITDRGRDLESVLKQYMKFVKPSYDHIIAPTMRHADIIVPRGVSARRALLVVHSRLLHNCFAALDYSLQRSSYAGSKFMTERLIPKHIEKAMIAYITVWFQ